MSFVQWYRVLLYIVLYVFHRRFTREYHSDGLNTAMTPLPPRRHRPCRRHLYIPNASESTARIPLLQQWYPFSPLTLMDWPKREGEKLKMSHGLMLQNKECTTNDGPQTPAGKRIVRQKFAVRGPCDGVGKTANVNDD